LEEVSNPVTVPQPNYAGTSAKKVWLTFDDGPHPEFTEKVLDVLKAYHIGATFFVLGVSIERWGTAILERMGAEGHSIGNHAYSHADLTSLSENEVRDEIRCTESLIGRLPSAEKVFRPPYGASSPTVDRVVRELNYRKVLWNVDTRDWDPVYKPNHWVERALYRIHRRKRSVVIAHDIHKTTADHLADLLERIGHVRFERCTARKPES
jgi:peptidoglycan/xylan/chitin deacetylase (PgdA/CDA1 family)